MIDVCKKTFSLLAFENGDSFIGFYGDISIDYTTISNLIFLTEEKKNIELNNKVKDQAKEIIKLKKLYTKKVKELKDEVKELKDNH